MCDRVAEVQGRMEYQGFVVDALSGKKQPSFATQSSNSDQIGASWQALPEPDLAIGA